MSSSQIVVFVKSSHAIKYHFLSIGLLLKSLANKFDYFSGPTKKVNFKFVEANKKVPGKRKRVKSVLKE